MPAGRAQAARVDRVINRIAVIVGQWLMALLLLAGAGPATAGILDRAALEQHVHQRLGDGYTLGERLSQLPVWPVFSRASGKPSLHAYLFESIDIEPVRGYSGKPIDLLITLTPAGRFIDVSLIKHYEPIFQSESATRELIDFAAQYNDLTIDHDIQFFKAWSKPSRDETTASLHGVLRGTVSATAIDRSILSAAVRVAEAGLDDPSGQARKPAPGGRIKRMGWVDLQDVGLIQPIEHSNAELERAFAGTPGARRDAAGIFKPGALAIQAWAMPVGLPQVGRNVLDPDGWLQVHELAQGDRWMFLILDDSRYRYTDGGKDAPRLHTVPALRQDDQTFALQPFPYEHKMRLSGRGSGVPDSAQPRLFGTAGDSGFDITRPFSIESRVVRSDSEGVATAVRFEHPFPIPEAARWLPKVERPAWLHVWEQRRIDLIILGVALSLLTVGLVGQRWLSFPARRLSWVRTLWLVFTLVFIGWWAQGQLTIVNITSALEALLHGESIDFLLADPMSVMLWVFVGITLFVWGRGTFCGWLCPFGAFQELISTVAGWFGLKRRQLHSRLDADLKWLKYLVLMAIIIGVMVGSPFTPWMIEIEPFKTAISMSFERAWPYVAWASACLALTLVVYRGFCRYLCPLGAALALLGRVRLLRWVPRRSACGTPCQTCRFRCSYQSISPKGVVDYAECFQCLECVSIYQDDRRCMPLIVEARRTKQRVIPLLAEDRAMAWSPSHESH
ncbi:MAG: 4Fe-4S binding protein [Burkholderiaceae bacterium]